ncbi:MAG: SRPBCC domain-containing protein, partial [Candidatus Heimdallarchaeota archaeon]|nr:SRPBCC domain-containing protein [Candidatus Heimdallarchaeota archaeon]
MSKELTKTLVVDTTPDRVYQELMNSEQHAKVTGGPAEIENKEGGSFSNFGGQIYGTFSKLVENKEIVQQWRVGPWPDGYFSTVSFKLQEEGKKTKITFSHKGIPDEAADMINEGW